MAEEEKKSVAGLFAEIIWAAMFQLLKTKIDN